jgi:leucyl aminopeptidase
MPLHDAYDYMIKSHIADLVNSAASPYAGAVTAALFLKRFIDDVPWVHFDVMAFNIRKRPGRPEGGEAMALRSVYRYLAQRFGATDE